MIRHGDADPVGGRREIVAGIEQPVAALLPVTNGPSIRWPSQSRSLESTIVFSPISERPSSAIRWARIGVLIASRIAGGEAELDQRARLTRDQLASAASISGCIRKKRTIGRCKLAQARWPRRRRRCGGRVRSRIAARSVRMLAQQHRKRPWPNAVRVVLPEQIRARPHRRTDGHRSLRRSSAAWLGRGRTRSYPAACR